MALATTLVVPANLLILDEPTNHLDILSISVLIEALRQYTGTFAVVSHDRHFLDQVATRVWRVEDGNVLSFPGTYSEYLWKVRQEESADAPRTKPVAKVEASNGDEEPAIPTAVTADPVPSRDRPAQEDNPYRAMNDFRLRRAYEEIERAILSHEEKKKEIEDALGDPSLYADEERAMEVTASYDRVLSELEEMNARWEAVAVAMGERTV